MVKEFDFSAFETTEKDKRVENQKIENCSITGIQCKNFDFQRCQFQKYTKACKSVRKLTISKFTFFNIQTLPLIAFKYTIKNYIGLLSGCAGRCIPERAEEILFLTG